jgi:uncharacterized protein YjbJ (UPF0337 family)
MNWTQIESKWEQFKGDAKTRWAKLTDEDLSFVGGQRDRLLGKLHERYGVLKEDAMKDIDLWVQRLEERIDRVGTRGRAEPKP